MTPLQRGLTTTSVDYDGWELIVEPEAAAAAAAAAAAEASVVDDWAAFDASHSTTSGAAAAVTPTPFYLFAEQNTTGTGSDNDSGWPTLECVDGGGEFGGSCYPELHRFVVGLDRFLVPVIVAMGAVGNTMSFFVFTCTYMRRMSSSVYLAALAVVDTLFLIVLLFTWLTKIGVQVSSRRRSSIEFSIEKARFAAVFVTRLAALICTWLQSIKRTARESIQSSAVSVTVVKGSSPTYWTMVTTMVDNGYIWARSCISRT